MNRKKNLNRVWWLVAVIILGAWAWAVIQFLGPTLLTPLRAIMIPAPMYSAAVVTASVVVFGVIALIVRLLFRRHPDWQLHLWIRKRQRQGEGRDTVRMGGATLHMH